MVWRWAEGQKDSPEEGPVGGELPTSKDSVLGGCFRGRRVLSCSWRWRWVEIGVELGLGLRSGWGWGWLDVCSMSGIRGAPEGLAEVRWEGSHLGNW